MIKLFRNIRKKLIEQSKVRSYFFYAIGEIILVVIGILIALQINNWNENRKDRFVEHKILQSLNNDLATDIINMKRMIAVDSAINQSNRQLVKILTNSLSEYDETYSKMLGSISKYDVFYPQKMGYEALKSKGLEIIRNDSLKSQIINLHDFQYALIAESMDLKKQLSISTNHIFNEQLRTVVNDTFINITVNFIKVPNDFKALKRHDTFMGSLTHITVAQGNFINLNKTTLKKMESTKKNIEQEINK